MDGRDVVQKGATTIPLSQLLGMDTSGGIPKAAKGPTLGEGATVIDRAKTLGPGEKLGMLAITGGFLFVGLYSAFWLLFAPNSWVHIFSVGNYASIQRPAFGWCVGIAALVLSLQALILFS